MGELSIAELPVSRLEACLRWIHHHTPPAEMRLVLQEALQQVERDSGSLPLVVEVDGQMVAAAYFRWLPGRVATLGGVRAVAGHAASALLLLQQWQQRLVASGMLQIQAVVPIHDQVTQELVSQAGFCHLTCVRHLWLDLSSADPSSLPSEVISPSARNITWQPAQELAQVRMARLIETTFVDSLDCPALNGMRQAEDVLQGFLEGRTFRQVWGWELLRMDHEIAGCLLLSQHSSQLIELVYMGLVPAARGQGVGRLLVQRAIEKTRQQAAQALVAAVDEQNTPASQLYEAFGFQCHQELSVWLYPSA